MRPFRTPTDSLREGCIPATNPGWELSLTRRLRLSTRTCRPIFRSISSWMEQSMTGRSAELVEARLTPRSAADKGLPVLPGRPSQQPAAIVHLGLSNFHRAHQAIYTAQALDLEEGPWGIVGVARQSRDVLEAMNDQ